MEQLIPINEHNGKKAVSARNLYEFLEVKERFSKWFKRQLQFGFVENVDYTLYQMVHPSNNQETEDYALTGCAKEISMVQRSAKGKEARQYFIACEDTLNILVANQLRIAQESAKQRLIKSNRVHEIDIIIKSMMKERGNLVKEINRIDRTDFLQLSIPDFDLSDVIQRKFLSKQSGAYTGD